MGRTSTGADVRHVHREKREREYVLHFCVTYHVEYWSVREKGEILIGVCARVKKRDCERGVYESDAFGIGLVIFI